MQVNPISQLYTDFITVLEKSVIKYKSEADKYETLDIKKASDGYMRAVLKEDNFETYYRYEKSIIAKVLMLTEERDIDTYYLNKYLIPPIYRDAVLYEQRKYVIENYVEQNNYYRMLGGLPNIEDSELSYIYIPPEIASQYSLPTDIPIHEFDDSQIDILNSIGYIKTLIDENPTKKYLQYLGSNSIDIVTARRARNFGLIRMARDVEPSMYSIFTLIYEQCREYFMTCIYVREYQNTIDYYDNFIALCIMVMTWQQIISRTIKSTIERDFFDPYCCKLLFSVYNVPYYSEMDSNTRQQLVQNLNMLVQNKGTNKVIYDIASILGYDRLDIYKYYIVRTQKFDISGNPIYVTKVDPETGETVPDNKAMHNVYFQKVKVGDDDAYDAIVNSKDKQTYTEVTEGDPYWIDDDALQKELYDSEYNFVESKYMGVGISYRMTKILFENIYLMKMLLEKKDQIPYITVNIPKLSSYDSISLFDAIIVLCAMMCKQNRLKGEILTDPSKILHVLGFTFNEDWEIIHADVVNVGKCRADILGFNFSKSIVEIKDEIRNNEYLDDTLCDFFMDSALYTAKSINDLYNNYMGLYKALVDKMATTTDINVYHAYKKLYQALFFTKENNKMFNIGTDSAPQYARTYMEYLKYKLPEIYEFINNTGPDDMYSNVNYIVSRIKKILPELKYLGFFDGHSNTMEKMLLELINFFKSYTTDLISMNIIYIFDMKPDTLLRLIDYMELHVNIIPRDFFELSYADHLTFLSTVSYSSDLKLSDKVSLIHKLSGLFDTCKFIDSLNQIRVQEMGNDDLSYYDYINRILDTTKIDEPLNFKDSLEIVKNVDLSRLNNKITFKEIMTLSVEVMMYTQLSFMDSVDIVTKVFLKYGGWISFNDLSWLVTHEVLSSGYKMIDQLHVGHTDVNMNDICNLVDIVDGINKDKYVSDSNFLRDTCKIYYSD